MCMCSCHNKGIQIDLAWHINTKAYKRRKLEQICPIRIHAHAHIFKRRKKNSSFVTYSAMAITCGRTFGTFFSKCNKNHGTISYFVHSILGHFFSTVGPFTVSILLPSPFFARLCLAFRMCSIQVQCTKIVSYNISIL